jgi:hypothetical protein
MGWFRHPTKQPMITKRTARASLKTLSAAARQPSLYHRLDALLHTVRCIAQCEDTLCEFSHELKGARALSVEAIEELRDILEEIPSHDYLTDLESVKALLAKPEPPKRSGPKKAAKSAKVRKGLVGARKKSRMKSST